MGACAMLPLSLQLTVMKCGGTIKEQSSSTVAALKRKAKQALCKEHTKPPANRPACLVGRLAS